jgi:Na+-transporting methylmalonyl-CoA/oxaloacetate decarboxylase gamma subunit
MKKSILTILALGLNAASLLASNADNFREHDQYGLMMTVIAMGVVFIALAILFFCFKWLDKIVNAIWYNLITKPIKALRSSVGKKGEKTEGLSVKEAATGVPADDDEVIAAIGIALFLHEGGSHDNESDVLTLGSVTSGWTGVGNNQMRKPNRKW